MATVKGADSWAINLQPILKVGLGFGLYFIKWGVKSKYLAHSLAYRPLKYKGET